MDELIAEAKSVKSLIVWLVFGFIVLAILLLTFVILLPALTRMPLSTPALLRLREDARRASCADNLQKMGLIFAMYSNEAPANRYPSLVHRADLWTFDPKPLYPEYFTDLSFLKCPSSAASWDIAEEFSKILERKPVDYSRFAELAARDYVYLGWVVHDESDMQALAELRKNPGFDREAFKAVVGGKTLFRLCEGVERHFIVDTKDPAGSAKARFEIPVMFEAAYNHGQRGKNVLYLDGHVAFVKYGKFPATDAVNEALLLGLPKAPPKSFKSSWGCYGLSPN
jgi:prepilin-type processing-associated H-X9-DG protein